MGRSVWTVVILNAALAVITLAEAPDVAVAARRHEIRDPRPIARAVSLVQRRCACVITYEDPPYGKEDVEDWTARVRRDGKREPKIFAPPERVLTIDDDEIPPRGRPSSEIGGFLKMLIAQFDRHPRAPRFAVLEGDKALHMIPASGSVLRLPITIPRTSASADKLVVSVIQAVGAVSGAHIGLNGMEQLLSQTTTTVDAQAKPADDVLLQILNATGRRTSWQLLYDFQLRAYILNLEPIS